MDMIAVRGVLIRFTILLLLIFSLVLSAFMQTERSAFAGPVIMAALTILVLGLHFLYQQSVKPCHSDPMYTDKRDYLVAIAWCLGLSLYLEILAVCRYFLLPIAFPSVSVSPVVFQGLVLVPMAVAVTAFILWKCLLLLATVKRDFLAWHRRDPTGVRNTMKIIGAFILFVAGIVVFLQENTRVFNEGRIDWASYHQNISGLLWIIIIISLVGLVYIWVTQKTDNY